MKKILSSAIATLLLASLTSCGPKVEDINLTAPDVLNRGDNAQAAAAVLPPHAQDPTVIYSSSDEAVFAVDEAGNITAKGPGTATLTATAQGGEVAVTQEITVLAPVERIVAKPVLTFHVGGSGEMWVSLLPGDATDQAVTYHSLDETVVTVTAAGQLAAVGKGTTSIVATTANGLSASTSITVTQPVLEITLSDDSLSLTVGKTATLAASLLPVDADEGTSITWSSSDEAVATVDEEGRVTAVAAGTATITATTENGLEAECSVTVTKPAATQNRPQTSGGGSGNGGSTAGTTAGGTGGGETTPPPANTGLTDGEIQQIVASARAHATSLGLSIVGGLQYSWTSPTLTTGTYEQVLGSVIESINYRYADDLAHDDEFLPGTPISIEYIAGGPGGTGIYVSY